MVRQGGFVRCCTISQPTAWVALVHDVFAEDEKAFAKQKRTCDEQVH